MERFYAIGIGVAGALLGAMVVLALRLPPIPDAVAAWLTPFVGVATMAQAFFAYWALRGLGYSRVAAEAAAASVQLMERTSQRQLRAYVSVAQTEIDLIAVGQRIDVTVTARNSGQTPAYELVGFTGVTIRRADDELPLPDVTENLLPGASRATIGSGSSVSFTGRGLVALTNEILAELRNGEARLLVHGYIGYRDVFGAEQRTNFHFNATTDNPLGLTKLVRSAIGNDAT